MTTEVATFASTLPIWKTVRIGLYKTAWNYRRHLVSHDPEIDWDDYLLARTHCSQHACEIDLVLLTNRDLGLEGQDVHHGDIYAKAIELGLELCPAEVGPALRLQYIDQPRGDMVLVAMEAIVAEDGISRVWCVEHHRGVGSDGTLQLWGGWINSRYSDRLVRWHDGFKWLFVKPRH